ncbi:MAG TPA: hypothetical protein VHB77_18060 [Planctomycetaceae bacterium]|nr:hypothetical protein [Planctomycetaceae bacterium]
MNWSAARAIGDRHKRCSCRSCLPAWTLLLVWGLAGHLGATPPSTHWATGPAFHRALGLGVSATWRNGEYREALARLCSQQKVAWVLDRRLDPNRPLTAEYNNERLEAVLQELAGLQGGSTAILGGGVYLGPAQTASRLRTLAALREQELQSSAGASLARRNEMSKRHAVAWVDLDTPREVLERLAREHHLTIAGLDQIPHDLWGAGALPDANVCEALTVVLAQFDLTFAWNRGATGVTLAPIPEKVVLAKSLTATRGTTAETVRDWISGIPGLTAQLKGTKVVAEGTVEQLEALEYAMNPNAKPAKPETVEPTPIAKRKFKLKARDVPASALLQKLEDSGIIFSYNPETLKQHNINLEQNIKIDVESASPEEFFHAVFDPLKLNFRIDGLTVTLTPKE